MRKILGASIGHCVHVAGVFNFLRIAEQEGYATVNLGGAVSINELVGAIMEEDPDEIAIGYRLGNEPLGHILHELAGKLEENGLLNKTYIFGGTKETVQEAIKHKFILRVFDGSETRETIRLYLQKSYTNAGSDVIPPQNLVDRIRFKSPYPLIRHHIGLDNLEDTAKSIGILAESGLLDIISIAPDQNTQQFYFKQDKIDPRQNGAGGVPIRCRQDFLKLYEASRRGNYPLMRCYSGTENLLDFSKVLKDSINNAWAAVPMTWYSELDGRSERSLLDAIRENQEAIRWNAQNGVPVEINESHQWSLRYGHDALEVAIAYLAGYNAKKLGVKNYVMQFMLSTPPDISPQMDIAKALAKIELHQALEDESFNIIRMIRPGLLSYPSDAEMAKGQLASTVFYGACLNPHIVHVVAFCEALHRATHREIIESIKIATQVLKVAYQGIPDFIDVKVRDRKEQLKTEAMQIIEAVKNLGSGYEDPLLEPTVIYNAIKVGILDAPCLAGFPVAKGKVRTSTLNGAQVIIDNNGVQLNERQRLSDVFSCKGGAR
ncbi:hypothetical protein [Sporomusa aerivorans]|uniref:hypothetical protein n=1 Tax=Sporomusa aerivorans TaxID=204936 RepID=UPI00352BCD40